MTDKAHEEPRLLLVGTVHLDPLGHDRLLAWLGRAWPSSISLEVSPYAVSLRESEGPRLLARLDRFRTPGRDLPGRLEAIRAQLALPFEHTAARAYAAQAGIPLHLLGDSERSRELLGLLLAEGMTDDNLAALAAQQGMGSLGAQVEAEWRSARRYFAEGRPMGTAEAGRLDTEDAAMAARIRALGPPAAHVHVCGWEHLKGLVAHPENLSPEIQLLRG